MKQKIFKMLGLVRDPIIGIDICSSAVKILYLEEINNQYIISGYAIEELPPGVVVEKIIKNLDAVATAIKKAVERLHLPTVSACIAVPNAEAIIRIIQFSSDLNDKEIAVEIELEADRYIPYAIEEVKLDFVPLGKSTKSDDLIDVLLAISKRENVERRVQLLTSAGLRTSIVDIDSFAVEQAFALLKPQLTNITDDLTIAIVDIGATLTTLNILQHKRTIYTREQAFGGKHLIDEIENRYGLSHEEALLAIKYHNLPDDYVIEVLQPFQDTIVKQVSRACQFFFSSSTNQTINYMFLTGGTSSLPGLDELIAAETGVRTSIANPFANMGLAKSINEDLFMQDMPRLLNCCGLAIRNCLTI